MGPRIRPETDYPSVAAGLLPESGTGATCTDGDALIIDACVGRLRQKRPDEYELLKAYYMKGVSVSKRALGRRLKLSEGMIRIKFQMAEGFIEGCLSMLDVRLEMDAEI